MASRRTGSRYAYETCGNMALYQNSGPRKPCTVTTCSTLGLANQQSRQLFRDVSKGTTTNMYKEIDANISNVTCTSGQGKVTDAAIQDIYKRFGKPIVPYLIPKVHTIEMPQCFNRSVLNDVILNAQKHCYSHPLKSDPYRNVGTQTDYRDSEAQTEPWEPPYRVHAGHNPEVLTLAHLTWESGVPIGKCEIEVIRRMRMKKAWEAVLPPMDTPENIRMRTSIISAIEIDEWAFRESEIQSIMDLRMKLMKELTERRDADKNMMLRGRYKRLRENLGKRREKQMKNIHQNLNRELRKLYRKHHEKKPPHKRDIIALHADPASEIYAPQMMFGEHPERRHEVLQKRFVEEHYVDRAEKEDTTPSWLPTHEELKAIKSKPKPADLCIRETRWTEEKLKQLHADLKTIRLNVKSDEKIALMKEKQKPFTQPPTPVRVPSQDTGDEHLHQAARCLQKLIRGRAVQYMMYEGRDRCRELIEELKLAHPLETNNRKNHQKEKEYVAELQRQQDEKLIEEERLSEVLSTLEGATVAGVLDYLSKELIRLQDERTAHAFALLAERERADREAAEAGRRQLEQNRRREFDEMFRQIVKVNEDTVDCYLQDIIEENIEWVADKEAKKHIAKIAGEMESAAAYAMENATELEEEEMVADMVYNFVLPEVEKENARRRIKERQQSYLRNAHKAIYDQIVELPAVKLSESPGPSKETLDETSTCKCWDEILPSEEHYGEYELKERSAIMNQTDEVVQHILDSLIEFAVPMDGYEIVNNLLDDILTEVVGSNDLWTESGSWCESCSDENELHQKDSLSRTKT